MSASDILSYFQSIEKRLAAIEATMGNSCTTIQGDDTASSPAVSAATTEELPRSIKAFDDYCASNLTPFVSACAKLGGDAEKGGKLVAEAWGEMRTFILMASKCKEPAASAIPPLLSGIGAKMKEISAMTQRNEFERHFKTISEVSYQFYYEFSLYT